MTGTEMIDMLGLRLEDPDQASFTSATKIKAINIAQRTVVNLIDNAYLTELQEIDTATFANTVYDDTTGNGLDADGKATFTNLGIDPIRGGVIAINVYDINNSNQSVDLGFANMIEPKDAKRLENSYLAGSDSNPVAYIFNETIYVKPVKPSGGIDVWYLKNPTDIADNSTECELNVALHEIVLDFAESQLWKMDNKVDRATISYTNAINQIKALNDRYQVEKPKGIGTQGRA